MAKLNTGKWILLGIVGYFLVTNALHFLEIIELNSLELLLYAFRWWGVGVLVLSLLFVLPTKHQDIPIAAALFTFFAFSNGFFASMIFLAPIFAVSCVVCVHIKNVVKDDKH